MSTKKNKKIRPIIGRIGGKTRIAPWIISHLSQYHWSNYVEPFCGSAAVYFRMITEGIFDRISDRGEQPRIVLNDADSQIVELFRVCRDFPHALAWEVAATPYSREVHKRAKEDNRINSLVAAGEYLTANWQSRNGGSDTSRSNQWSVSLYQERCRFGERLGLWNDLPNRILDASPHLQSTDCIDSPHCLNEVGRRFVQPPLSQAINRSQSYLVSNWQSQSADGGWSFETQGKRSRQTQCQTIPDRLLDSVVALKQCYIENDDAIACMERWQSPHTCFYLDPPYVDLEGYYSHNMEAGKDANLELHYRLASCVQEVEAACVAISYYPHLLIDELYPETLWERHYKETVAWSVGLGKNAKSKKRPKRTELLLVRRDGDLIAGKSDSGTQLRLF